MLHVPETILPIFSIILLGFLLKQKRVIDQPFAKTANQLVFYVAIPAMLFDSISRAPFKENFQLTAVICLLLAITAQLILSLATTRLMAVPPKYRGTFLQSSFHGNLGYMAYAVAYYSLGQTEFARTAILSSFLMIAQNLMAVWVLIAFRPDRQLNETNRGKVFVRSIFRNPIIMAVVVSMVYSALALPVPVPIQRGLKILSGMALPTALLLIGASLSFTALRLRKKELVSIGALKLICFPLLGLIIMKLGQVPDFFILPALILLAAPPATVTYVMAVELKGDPELAASGISVLTLASAVSYSILLFLFT